MPNFQVPRFHLDMENASASSCEYDESHQYMRDYNRWILGIGDLGPVVHCFVTYLHETNPVLSFLSSSSPCCGEAEEHRQCYAGVKGLRSA